jgi:hypothetical protein
MSLDDPRCAEFLLSKGCLCSVVHLTPSFRRITFDSDFYNPDTTLTRYEGGKMMVGHVTGLPRRSSLSTPKVGMRGWALTTHSGNDHQGGGPLLQAKVSARGPCRLGHFRGTDETGQNSLFSLNIYSDSCLTRRLMATTIVTAQGCRIARLNFAVGHHLSRVLQQSFRPIAGVMTPTGKNGQDTLR